MSDCRFGVSPVNYPDPDPDSCASVNNNKKCAIGRSENERKSVLWGKMFIFVVAYMNMINDVDNLT